jgi:hypothetical protein
MRSVGALGRVGLSMPAAVEKFVVTPDPSQTPRGRPEWWGFIGPHALSWVCDLNKAEIYDSREDAARSMGMPTLPTHYRVNVESLADAIERSKSPSYEGKQWHKIT